MADSFKVGKGEALGKVASGLFVVTASENGQQDGYLASFIQQISFEPMLISSAVKPGRPAYDIMKSKGKFTINIVGSDNNGVMKPFWSGYSPETNPFENLKTEVSESGELLLLDCAAALECVVKEWAQPGDHELAIAEVTAEHIFKADDKPLTHIRKSGLKY